MQESNNPLILTSKQTDISFTLSILEVYRTNPLILTSKQTDISFILSILEVYRTNLYFWIIL